MTSIRFLPDIRIETLDDQSIDIVVNPVNTVGVMGAGVAKACRQRWPGIMAPYEKACHDGTLKPGRIQCLRSRDGTVVVNLASKQHWREASRYDWVGVGLIRLSRYIQKRIARDAGSTTRVLLPLPGAGHGGLEPERILAMARSYLRPVLDAGVEIVVPTTPMESRPIPTSYTGIGSRKTPIETGNLMTEIARDLAEEGWILRSGGARGADTAFANGAPATLREIYVTATGENGTDISEIPVKSDAFRDLTLELHPAPEHLSPYATDLMTRNIAQICGIDCVEPVRCVICWTEGGHGTGGTGQALRLARSIGIPVIDLGLPGMQDSVARAAPSPGCAIRSLLEDNSEPSTRPSP